MARSYYSVVLEHPVERVWAVIRSFEQYAWAGVAAQTVIEDGKAGDQVGAIRRITSGDRTLRQQLLALSDVERSVTYALCEPPPYPVRGYVATLRLSPVVATRHTFAEWWATFDVEADEQDRWTRYFEREGFAVWLAALGSAMASPPGSADTGPTSDTLAPDEVRARDQR
jgi:hypothetical protein